MEKDRVKFQKECQEAVQVSRQTLFQILQDNKDTEYGKKHNFAGIKGIEEIEKFRKLPITDYEDYKEDVIRMMKGEENILTAYPVEYFLASSGSAKQKLIPITKQGLNKGFDVFYCVALNDDVEWEKAKHLHTSIVRTKREDKVTFLSNVHFLNERENNPVFFNKFLGGETLMFSKEIEDHWYVKLWLALSEPKMKSIYSIYQYDILLFLQYFKEHWRELLRDMENKSIPDSTRLSENIKEKLLRVPLPGSEWFEFVRKECEKGFEGIVKRIWKECEMINGIGGKVFGTQEQMLRFYLGDISIHYFVYASSEAPIGIAIEKEQDSYVCIPHGCFIEFLPWEEEGEDVKWIDELEVGKKYELLITNFCGFYRYRLLDVVEIVGFYGKSPILRFAFRKNLAVNIAGEKTNLSMIAEAAREIAEALEENISEYSVCVDEGVIPNRYCFFLEGEYRHPEDVYGRFLDESLCKKNRDYEDLRQLKQVSAPVCFHVEDGSHAAWKEKQGKSGHSKPIQFSVAEGFQEFMMGRVRKIGTKK